LPPEEAVKAQPELATAYASIEAIRHHLATSGLSEKQQTAVLDQARSASADHTAKNDVPNVDIKDSHQVDRPADRSADRER